MKNKLIILLLLLLTGNIQIKAQKYEEPQWKIPLYFEDATGAKDTIWIGYDPDADSQLETIDPQFNEGWISIDTTEFNAYIWKYPNYSPSYPIDTDTVRKTTITSWNMPYSELGFVKGVMPIIMRWDKNKLNSQNLPDNFPDIYPNPRARIDMFFDYGSSVTNPDCLVIYDGPTLVLTSYINGLEMYPCVKTDSVIFNNPVYVEPGASFSTMLIQIMPYDYSYASVNTTGNKMLSVNPNIFKEDFYITNKSDECFFYEIYLLTGEKLLQGEINMYDEMKRIDMSLFSKGIYLIKFFNNKNNITYKLFKTH